MPNCFRATLSRMLPCHQLAYSPYLILRPLLSDYSVNIFLLAIATAVYNLQFLQVSNNISFYSVRFHLKHLHSVTKTTKMAHR